MKGEANMDWAVAKAREEQAAAAEAAAIEAARPKAAETKGSVRKKTTETQSRIGAAFEAFKTGVANLFKPDAPEKGGGNSKTSKLRGEIAVTQQEAAKLIERTNSQLSEIEGYEVSSEVSRARNEYNEALQRAHIVGSPRNTGSYETQNTTGEMEMDRLRAASRDLTAAIGRQHEVQQQEERASIQRKKDVARDMQEEANVMSSPLYSHLPRNERLGAARDHIEEVRQAARDKASKDYDRRRDENQSWN